MCVLHVLIVIICVLVGKSLLTLVLEQFDDLLVKILLLAAVISLVSINYFIKYITDYKQFLCWLHFLKSLLDFAELKCIIGQVVTSHC